jgi:hypothetical protein
LRPGQIVDAHGALSDHFSQTFDSGCSAIAGFKSASGDAVTRKNGKYNRVKHRLVMGIEWRIDKYSPRSLGATDSHELIPVAVLDFLELQGAKRPERPLEASGFVHRLRAADAEAIQF